MCKNKTLLNSIFYITFCQQIFVILFSLELLIT